MRVKRGEGIVRHDSHMQIYRSNPAGNRTRFALVGGEKSQQFTTAASRKHNGYRWPDIPISISSRGDGPMRKDAAPRATLAYIGALFDIFGPRFLAGAGGFQRLTFRNVLQYRSYHGSMFGGVIKQAVRLGPDHIITSGKNLTALNLEIWVNVKLSLVGVSSAQQMFHPGATVLLDGNVAVHRPAGKNNLRLVELTTSLPPERTRFDSRGFTSGFSHVGIEPDDASGWRAFSGISVSSPLNSGTAPYPPCFALIVSQDLVHLVDSEVIRDGASCTRKRDWGRIRKESAMVFIWDPSEHSPGVISENHGNPKSGWPDRMRVQMARAVSTECFRWRDSEEPTADSSTIERKGWLLWIRHRHFVRVVTSPGARQSHSFCRCETRFQNVIIEFPYVVLGDGTIDLAGVTAPPPAAGGVHDLRECARIFWKLGSSAQRGIWRSYSAVADDTINTFQPEGRQSLVEATWLKRRLTTTEVERLRVSSVSCCVDKRVGVVPDESKDRITVSTNGMDIRPRPQPVRSDGHALRGIRYRPRGHIGPKDTFGSTAFHAARPLTHPAFRVLRLEQADTRCGTHDVMAYAVPRGQEFLTSVPLENHTTYLNDRGLSHLALSPEAVELRRGYGERHSELLGSSVPVDVTKEKDAACHTVMPDIRVACCNPPCFRIGSGGSCLPAFGEVRPVCSN
ncbi:hypothetical protein PR048_019761 [Dryococelus australis]|uniref:Uncharacterized protein n=1 Tax=Dryococelus australis TaxID=614101 RepID=A0ABQ9H4E1_9NEOP|nr:hypothetical protein PR048_019761 [Dryococelus australis]